MEVLIHSSKTMKPTTPSEFKLSEPVFIKQATEIAKYLNSLDVRQIQKTMGVSENLALEIIETINSWSIAKQGAAMYTFRGDVYSGLQVGNLSVADVEYANKHLRIISGLYGILKPLDGISPYRLEMGYKLPNKQYSNLYAFWADQLAKTLPEKSKIVNLTSAEYGKAIIKYLEKSRVISPRFLTYDKSTRTNKTVAVHSKIARGAFANWLIKKQVDKSSDLINFNDLGYEFRANLSSELEPSYVCKEFGGKGLSVRLK